MNGKPTLWTRNFTLITLSTVIIAIGYVAMDFVMSLVVFDQTGSTLMTGLFTAVAMVPNIVVPLLAAPIIDMLPRRKILIVLGLAAAVCYVIFALLIRAVGFSYPLYIAFALIVNSVETILPLSYQSLYPDLIPAGFAQKGYSVSALIFPSITAVITPVASLIYTQYGMWVIFMMQGVLMAVSSTFYLMIRIDESSREGRVAGLTFSRYREEFLGGFRYLRNEHGVRNLYTYMMFTNACGSGTNMMAMAHFQSSPILTTAMYSFLFTAETIGRMLGGLTHYVIKIPANRRYAITRLVYVTYQTCDGILLFVAYPLMLALRFVCGFLGINSATLREAAVQNYMPPDIRARVMSLFNVLITSGVMLMQLLGGALGEIIPYRFIALGFGLTGLTACYFLIIRKKKEISAIYDTDYRLGEPEPGPA